MTGDASLRRFDNGASILRQGSRGDSMYMVISGKVRIYRESDDGEATLGIVGPGEIFGEMALFDDEPRSASATALGPTAVRIITREEFVLEECSPLVRQVLKQTALRLRAMNSSCERLVVAEHDGRDSVQQIPLSREWLV